MVQILMAIAIIIAVLGIVNTLALSVIERTANSACGGPSGFAPVN